MATTNTITTGGTYGTVKAQQCLAEKCVEQIRKERGLPKGAPVPVMISCSCPKCNPVHL